MDCTIEREHELKTKGVFKEYGAYKVWTRAIIFGKTKLDELRQSLSDLKEEYEMIGSDGKVTETWKLPKSIEEVRVEINEMITKGEKEVLEIEEKRNQAFDKLREANMEHYL
jgi:hypothetical protein